MTYKYNTVNNTAKNNTNLDYTIDLSKYFTTTTSSKKSDYTISILDKIKSIFPWANKNDNKYTILTLDNAPYENYTILNITPEALNLEWNKAASRLFDYIYYTENPSYDFKIGDIPVKIHGNYIQVGSRLIPKFTSSSFFNDIPKKDRIILYNISMNINSLEIAA